LVEATVMGIPDGFDSELKADANEPDGEIRVQPAGPRVPAQLGGLFRPVYELKAPSGTTVWSHNYNLDLVLAVPKSETKLDELSSRSDRGPLPVIDEVQVGEELVVTGTTELLDRTRTLLWV